jgi:hypothetical protein
VYGLQSLDKLEETIPKFNDVAPTTWWHLFLEVLLKSAFVGKFKQNIEVVPMSVAAEKPDNAL